MDQCVVCSIYSLIKEEDILCCMTSSLLRGANRISQTITMGNAESTLNAAEGIIIDENGSASKKNRNKLFHKKKSNTNIGKPRFF